MIRALDTFVPKTGNPWGNPDFFNTQTKPEPNFCYPTTSLAFIENIKSMSDIHIIILKIILFWSRRFGDKIVIIFQSDINLGWNFWSPKTIVTTTGEICIDFEIISSSKINISQIETKLQTFWMILKHRLNKTIQHCSTSVSKFRIDARSGFE